MGDLFGDFGGVFLEVPLVARGELARLEVEQAERADGLAAGRAERGAGVEAQAARFDERVARKATVAGEVFDDEDLIARDDVAADGDVARRLAGGGEIVGEADVRFEKKPVAIDE